MWKGKLRKKYTGGGVSRSYRLWLTVLCVLTVALLLPVQSLAANTTGHQISIKVYKVVLDATKPLGYQNPELVNTIVLRCIDKTAHSGYNHSVSLKSFYPTEVGLTTTNWTGWEFDSYYTKGKENETFYNWTNTNVNATANVTGSEPYPCSKNFYLVYNNADPTPPTPSGDPASDDLKKALERKIKVECNRVTGHNAIYGLLNGSYDVGTRSGNTYTFTVKAEKYVDTFNQTYSNHALVSPESQQITLTYDNGEWKYNGAVAATFTVHCEEPAPQNPTENDVLGLGLKVKLDCETYPSGDHGQEYPFEAGTFTISNISGDAAGSYTCTITVEGEGYLAKLNNAFPTFKHTWASDAEKSITLKYDQAGAKWTLQDDNDNPVTFAVKCEGVTPPTGDTPDGPDGDVVKALLKVSLQCTVKSDHKKDYSQLLSASYEIGNVQSDGNNGYICLVSIFANPYIDDYSAESSVPHTLGGEPTQTVTLKYNKELGNWAVDGGSGVVTFLMKCSEEPIGPGEPTDEDIKKLGECVEIICQNAAAGHEAQYAALAKGTFEVKVDVSADIPTATIILNNPKPYALIYDMNLQSGATHAVTSFSGSVTLRYRGGRWGLVEDDMGSWPPFRVNLTCAAAPTDQPTPTPAPAANVPKTGDNSQLGLWLALLLGSGMAVLLLAQNRRRKNAK